MDYISDIDLIERTKNAKFACFLLQAIVILRLWSEIENFDE